MHFLMSPLQRCSVQRIKDETEFELSGKSLEIFKVKVLGLGTFTGMPVASNWTSQTKLKISLRSII